MRLPFSRQSARQRGFTLVELSVVLLGAMMLSTWFLMAQREILRTARADAAGDQVSTLVKSLASYATDNYNAILTGGPPAGPVTTTNGTVVADRFAPTLAELQAAGYLHGGFSATNVLGSGYGLAVSMQPGGCTPLVNCDLQSLAYTNAPLMGDNGVVDYDSLGEATKHIGAMGGVSYADNMLTPNGVANNISGLAGGWAMPNPDAAKRSGLLFAYLTYNSAGLSQFLRRDGTLPMLGTLQMRNNTIQWTDAGGVNTSAITNTDATIQNNIRAQNIAAAQNIGADNGVAPWGGGSWVAYLNNLGNAIINNVVTAGSNIFSTAGQVGTSPDGVAWRAVMTPAGLVTAISDIYSTGGSVGTQNAGAWQAVMTNGGVAQANNSLRVINGAGATVWQANNAGDQTMLGNMQISGNSTIAGSESVGVDLNVTGNASVGGNVNANGDVYGNFLVPKTFIVAGTNCTFVGQIAVDSNGVLYTCQR